MVQTRDLERPRRLDELTFGRGTGGAPQLAVIQRERHGHRNQEHGGDEQQRATATGARILHQDTFRKLRAK
jgi:hypothetical protein